MRARGFRLALGLWLAGAAACGGDPQIVLELAGDVPGARSVDVVPLQLVEVAACGAPPSPLECSIL
jgi:hypothetical protein